MVRGLPKHLRSGFRYATAPMRVLPNFIIIGAQKAGTTSLFRYLAQHPQVRAGFSKELHYFDLHFERGEKWYRSRFDRAAKIPGDCITGEASPYYLSHPHVPGRIRALLPRAKLIVLLRNPTERAISHYFHEVRKGRESLSIMDALEAEPERLRAERAKMLSDPSYVSPAHRAFSYVERGIYLEQLQRYWKFFDPSQLLILEASEFFRNPRQVLEETCAFLGISTDCKRIDLSPMNVGLDKQTVAPEVIRYLDEKFERPNQLLSDALGRRFDWSPE